MVLLYMVVQFRDCADREVAVLTLMGRFSGVVKANDPAWISQHLLENCRMGSDTGKAALMWIAASLDWLTRL